jgi:hypothetical protein
LALAQKYWVNKQVLALITELPSIFRLPTGGFYAACWKTKNRGKLTLHRIDAIFIFMPFKGKCLNRSQSEIWTWEIAQATKVAFSLRSNPESVFHHLLPLSA